MMILGSKHVGTILMWNFYVCASVGILIKYFLINVLKNTALNIKFHENSSIVACGETDGRTDRLDKADSHFYNFVNTPKNG